MDIRGSFTDVMMVRCSKQRLHLQIEEEIRRSIKDEKRDRSVKVISRRLMSALFVLAILVAPCPYLPPPPPPPPPLLPVPPPPPDPKRPTPISKQRWRHWLRIISDLRQEGRIAHKLDDLEEMLQFSSRSEANALLDWFTLMKSTLERGSLTARLKTPDNYMIEAVWQKLRISTVVGIQLALNLPPQFRCATIHAMFEALLLEIPEEIIRNPSFRFYPHFEEFPIGQKRFYLLLPDGLKLFYLLLHDDVWLDLTERLRGGNFQQFGLTQHITHPPGRLKRSTSLPELHAKPQQKTKMKAVHSAEDLKARRKALLLKDIPEKHEKPKLFRVDTKLHLRVRKFKLKWKKSHCFYIGATTNVDPNPVSLDQAPIYVGNIDHTTPGETPHPDFDTARKAEPNRRIHDKVASSLNHRAMPVTPAARSLLFALKSHQAL